MLDIAFARWQMGWSLGFHIIFASVGVAMPVLMVAAELAWRRTGDAAWLELARRWAKGTAVFFAVGAVSGTALSFELGLLFPTFMRHAGPIIGLPFSLEGFAFFTEAIFLGLYLYGWEKLSPRLHVLAGVVVAVSGLASAAFVTFVNAWMNAPTGVVTSGGNISAIDPFAALGSPFAWHEIPHAALAAYATTGFAVAAIHAWGARRTGSEFHRRALRLAIAMAIPAALLQPVVGDFAGKQVATYQPAKLAAMEAVEHTQARAPVEIGPIAIPGMLSWLATGDSDATVQGLDAFAPSERPPSIIHAAFQIMVALGSAMALYAVIALWRAYRRKLTTGAWWLVATIALGPAGALATEAGWIVTEVGRQPWTVYGILRTHDAATTRGNMWLPLATFAILYIGLAVVVVTILVRQFRATAEVT